MRESGLLAAGLGWFVGGAEEPGDAAAFWVVAAGALFASVSVHVDKPGVSNAGTEPPKRAPALFF